MVITEAAELVCGYCDPRATCGVCRFYQFLKTLDYITDGLTVQDAAERAENDGWEAVRDANRRHDEGRKARGNESPIQEAEQAHNG